MPMHFDRLRLLNGTQGGGGKDVSSAGYRAYDNWEGAGAPELPPHQFVSAPPGNPLVSGQFVDDRPNQGPPHNQPYAGLQRITVEEITMAASPHKLLNWPLYVEEDPELPGAAIRAVDLELADGAVGVYALARVHYHDGTYVEFVSPEFGV